MALLGAVVSIHSASFHIGSLRQMGPGFFPFSLGLLLTAVGLVIGVRGAVLRSSEVKTKERPEWKAWFLVCLGVVAFIVLAKFTGLVAATFSIVFISAFADRANSWRDATVLAICMVVACVVIFWWALRIPMPLFKWGLV